MINDWKTKLRQQFDENPIGTIGVLALAATAGAKVINSLSSAQANRTWAKEVDRRQKRDRLR